MVSLPAARVRVAERARAADDRVAAVALGHRQRAGAARHRGAAAAEVDGQGAGGAEDGRGAGGIDGGIAAARLHGVDPGAREHAAGGAGDDVLAARVRVDFDDQRAGVEGDVDRGDVMVGGDRRGAGERVVDLDRLIRLPERDRDSIGCERNLAVGCPVPYRRLPPQREVVSAVRLLHRELKAAGRHPSHAVGQRGRGEGLRCRRTVREDGRQIVDRGRRDLRRSVVVEQPVVIFRSGVVRVGVRIEQLVEVGQLDPVRKIIEQGIHQQLGLDGLVDPAIAVRHRVVSGLRDDRRPAWTVGDGVDLRLQEPCRRNAVLSVGMDVGVVRIG